MNDPMKNSNHSLVCCISCGRDTRNASRICTQCGGRNFMPPVEEHVPNIVDNEGDFYSSSGAVFMMGFEKAEDEQNFRGIR